ncbi:hypothetical protein AVEN_27673-1 [Araneus ventricosus]|uniref:Uncharacterized protein n=1 Tax=Araneus ventricosus TaxID=182803 RepID=A0A4Y2SCU8_ARAVE|nr:hypothetical protein AVEN_27673-1 [Araneus ventricosus]
MDSPAPFPLFYSLQVVGDMNGRPFISPLRAPLMITRPTISPLSEQQPAEIRPTSIEVAWPVTAGLGVKVLMVLVCRKNQARLSFECATTSGSRIDPLQPLIDLPIPPPIRRISDFLASSRDLNLGRPFDLAATLARGSKLESAHEVLDFEFVGIPSI